MQSFTRRRHYQHQYGQPPPQMLHGRQGIRSRITSAQKPSKFRTSFTPATPVTGQVKRDRPKRRFLELFSGCGRLSGACAARDLAIAPPMDICRGSFCDLTDWRVERV
eukprot:1162751-Karenia_brevis.AAC.1